MEWWIILNIFILDDDPSYCAEMHSDRHVVKMILESAQMICTTHHLHPNKEIKYDIPYKKTHVNHPCTVWVRETIQNYRWLMNLLTYLNSEYRKRYNKIVNHKSYDAVRDLPEPYLKDMNLTTPALAMPDVYKISEDPVVCYRTYYAYGKEKLLNYTRSVQPDWIEHFQTNKAVRDDLRNNGYDFNR